MAWYALNPTSLVISGPYDTPEAARTAVPTGIVNNDHGYLEDQASELAAAQNAPGGAVDLTGLTTPLGWEGGPSFVWGDSEQWGAGYPVLSLLGLSDGEFDIVDSSFVAVDAAGTRAATVAPGQVSAQGTAGEPNYPVINAGEMGGYYAFSVNADGSLHWGDGAHVQDLTLQRSDPGSLTLQSPGSVGAFLDFSDVSNPFDDGGLASYVTEIGSNGFLHYWPSTTAADAAKVIDAAAWTDTASRFTLLGNGRMEWGDGANPADSALYRKGGFGAGYGELEMDAGGGFSVVSSAPEASGSFVQIHPDSGYGSELWVHNLVGHTSQDALYFDVAGEGQPRFRAGIDGSLHWGDGTAAPDVTLSRIDDSGGALLVKGDSLAGYGELVISHADAATVWSGSYLDLYQGPGLNGPAGVYGGQQNGEVWENFSLVTGQGLTLTGSDNVYSHLSRNSLAFGAASGDDTSLLRTAPGILQLQGGEVTELDISDPSGSGGAISSWVTGGTPETTGYASTGEKFDFYAYDGGAYLCVTGVDADAAEEIYFGKSSWETVLYRHAARTIGIRGASSGYVAHASDGTAYKLVPPVGGGAATWVAA